MHEHFYPEVMDVLSSFVGRFLGFPESRNCQIKDLFLALVASPRTAWFG
tara:strand:- start:2789 stop:2935 length:147 start_codon:yes stop_codon:yes gene_type:complete